MRQFLAAFAQLGGAALTFVCIWALTSAWWALLWLGISVLSIGLFLEYVSLADDYEPPDQGS